MATHVLCPVTIFIALDYKQVCLEHCIAMFTQIITIADSTISAVQILKVTCGRWDPLIAQTVCFSLKGFVYPFTECWLKTMFFRLFLSGNGKQQELQLGRT